MDILHLLTQYNVPSETKLFQKWERLLHNVHSSHLKIVNAGKVNAGKSSLFNALLNKTSEEFKTGPVRETKSKKSLIHHNIEYIDTPGLEADDSDTKEAFDAYKYADIILFLHNVQSGEYHEAEVAYIEKMMNLFISPEDFFSKTIFLATHIDSVPDSNVLKMTYEKMGQQLNTLLGGQQSAKVILHQVSVKRYNTGKEKQKPILMEKSGIIQLQKLIEERSLLVKNQLGNDLSQLLEASKKETTKYLSNLKGELEVRIEENQKECDQLIQKKQKALKNITENLEAKWNNVRRQLDEISGLERQLRNL